MAQATKIKPVSRRNTLGYFKRGLQEGGFLLFLGIALYLLVALLSFDPQDPAWTHTGSGKVNNLVGDWGAWLADIAFYFFGYLAYLFPLSVALCGWRLFKHGALTELDAEFVLFRVLGFAVALGAGCGLASLHLRAVPGSGSGGGIVGDVTGPGLLGTFSSLGGYSALAGHLFMTALFLAAITLATGRSWLDFLELIGKLIMGLVAGLTGLVAWVRAWLAAPPPLREKAAPVIHTPERTVPHPAIQAAEPSLRAVAPAAPLLPEPIQRIEPVIRISDLAEPPDTEPLAASRQAPQTQPRKPLPAGPAVAVAAERLAPDPEPEFLTEAPLDHAALPLQVARAAPVQAEPLPPLDLLDPAPSEQRGYAPDILEEMSRRVETLLQDFGIQVRVVAVEPGPVITRFELEPAPGVKVSQISNLAKDLARGLSVLSVRVVEVIPGKSVIGLEIPNQDREIVYLSEILNSPIYSTSSSPLTIALGKDIGGNPVVANLAKMPHLLVAGTTGSGKSVALNAMLLSLLYKATPQETRLILVDPKMLELSIYEAIPHLLTPVVTDMKEAANALRWCVAEMERRYRLMATLKVRHITAYNRLVGDALEAGQPLPDPLHRPEETFEDAPAPVLEPLPYIVVVIDELADMMIMVGKKVEELIARLAQKARAAGIHLILATQRPSVDVITGLIKANIPTRIAFQVSSKVDSRTIIDQMGAEQLLGNGDMLYLPPGTGFPKRLHGAFVSDQEVVRVVEYLRQTGAPGYISAVLEEPQEPVPGLPAEYGNGNGNGNGENDPLYDQAVRIVTETRRASISGVQRRLKIGYNRAARMMEEMEAAGVVGPLQSNGYREVLVPPPPEVG